MEGYQTEDLQIKNIKNFLQKNSNKIMWIFIIITLIVGLSKYWQHHQQVNIANAASNYQNLINAVQSKDFTTAKMYGKKLQTQYKKSYYAGLASLLLAKLELNDQHFDAAINEFDWIIANQKRNEIIILAKLRKARILLAQNELDAALDTIQHKNINNFSMVFYEVTGDIYRAKGEFIKAREYYQQAIDASKNTNRNIGVELKLNDLGGKLDA